MKKHKLLLLPVTLLFAVICLIFASAAQNPGRYAVAENFASLYAADGETMVKLGELPKGTIVDITLVSGNYGFAYIPTLGINACIPMSQLTEYDAPAQGSAVTHIELETPVKTEYTQGEQKLDITGMKVFAVYEDGSKREVTGYKVYCDAFTSPGEKEVTTVWSPEGTWDTFSAVFTVTVSRIPVKELTLVSLPQKTEYIEHEKADLTGLRLRLAMADGSVSDFTADEIAKDPDFTVVFSSGSAERLEKGVTAVTVSYLYEDISITFELTAAERSLTAFYESGEHSRIAVYSEDEKPNLGKLKFTAEYDNGEKQELTVKDCEVEYPAKYILGDTNKAVISYGNFSVTVYFRYGIIEEAGLKLRLPQNLVFFKGENITLEGLGVYIEYTDGTIEPQTDYTVTRPDNMTVGSQNILVVCGKYSDVFTITVTSVFAAGDVNGDGKQTAEDARLILRAAVGYFTYSGRTFEAADVDSDGKITANDARLTLRAAVGLENLYLIKTYYNR